MDAQAIGQKMASLVDALAGCSPGARRSIADVARGLGDWSEASQHNRDLQASGLSEAHNLDNNVAAAWHAIADAVASVDGAE